jgi:hypothetical protein
MSRTLGVIAVLVLAWGARAEEDAQQRHVNSYAYLSGTWRCAHQVGSFSGTYTTTYAKAPGDRWLRQVYEFPAANGKPGWQAEAIMGWDDRRQAWVRFLALSTGEYFALRLTEKDGGWSWKYVSFFPRKSAETSEPDAILTRKSDSEYSIEGPTYPQGGQMVTEHHQCKKE